MRGGIGWQMNEVFTKSGIFRPGESKHRAKTTIRSELARMGLPATWHNIGSRLPIYSYGTAQEYKDIWHSYANYAKGGLGLRDIEKTSGAHIKAYLEQRANSGISRATLAKESAAMAKMELALNMYSERYNRGNSYSFQSDIREVSRTYQGELSRFVGSRSYYAPEQLIERITVPEHQLTAKIQLESGARISEAGRIKVEQLRGIGTDRITGELRGYFGIVGKGGKANTLSLSPETYRRLEHQIEENGNHDIDHGNYREDLREAALATGQKYTGSHGLRWNFAANRMEELQEYGMPYEASLSETAHEMGHNRHDITEHYLD